VSTLSDRFFHRLARMGQRRHTNPAHYLVVWCLESGLRPEIVNSIGARGLNQMVPATLRGLGAPADFETLSAEEQLRWIEVLIADGERINGGPFQTAARYYHSNFFPRTMTRGSSPSTIVAAEDAADAHERAAYQFNRGLDANRDGAITLADLGVVLERVRPRFPTAFARLHCAVRALRHPGATWQAAVRRHSGVLGAAAGLVLVLSAVGLVVRRGP
jgi:hypothetical protein